MVVRIGTSGWSYDHWEGVLYPHQLPPRKELDCYIQHYQTVEVNSTYYRWPPNATFANWQQRLPQGFLMTVKAPRCRSALQASLLARQVVGTHE